MPLGEQYRESQADRARFAFDDGLDGRTDPARRGDQIIK